MVQCTLAEIAGSNPLNVALLPFQMIFLLALSFLRLKLEPACCQFPYQGRTHMSIVSFDFLPIAKYCSVWRPDTHTHTLADFRRKCRLCTVNVPLPGAYSAGCFFSSNYILLIFRCARVGALTVLPFCKCCFCVYVCVCLSMLIVVTGIARARACIGMFQLHTTV